MTSFDDFYDSTFLAEHRHPLNVAAHCLGVAAGLVLLVVAPLAGQPWWLVAWPVVHALPGLLGHRLFERNVTVGDVRLTRTDFPLWWFLVANHRLAAEVVLGRRAFDRRTG